jgi:hypothetical protein
MKLLALSLVVFMLSLQSAFALPPHRLPVGKIFMPEGKRDMAIVFECIGGVPYFIFQRARLPGERETGWPSKSSEQCPTFEFTSRDDKTAIKSLGAGEISDDSTRFLKKTDIPESDRPPTGYLTVDYSVKPPMVKLEKEAKKFSIWKISPAKRPNECYIENVTSDDRHAWLTFDDHPAATTFDGRGDHEVTDYRRAIVSFGEPRALKVVIENDEK